MTDENKHQETIPPLTEAQEEDRRALQQRLTLEIEEKIRKEVALSRSQTNKYQIETELPQAYHYSHYPFCAWYAYQLSREEKLPLPEWIGDYLDRVAANLIALEKEKKGDFLKGLSRALEMHKPGRGGKTGCFWQEYREVEAVRMVACLQQDFPLSQEKAIEDVAKENHVAPETVQTWIKKHRKNGLKALNELPSSVEFEMKKYED